MTSEGESTAGDRIRVGLLKCGSVRPEVAATHGDYPRLFGELMADHPVELVTFDVEHGQLPGSTADCDGWIVTGSASSVYDPLEWIPPVRSFVGDAVEREVPLVGVCFGHQLLAEALGGEVTRSERGWGIGMHHYDVIDDLPWWPPGQPRPSRFSLLASHADQVSRLPDGARILAASHHCPVAAYAVGARALAVQAHPEFTPPLVGELAALRREAIGPGRADAAIAGLDGLDRGDHDGSVVAGWFASVLVR